MKKPPEHEEISKKMIYFLKVLVARKNSVRLASLAAMNPLGRKLKISLWAVMTWPASWVDGHPLLSCAPCISSHHAGPCKEVRNVLPGEKAEEWSSSPKSQKPPNQPVTELALKCEKPYHTYLLYLCCFTLVPCTWHPPMFTACIYFSW